jgi:hypothetical protein
MGPSASSSRGEYRSTCTGVPLSSGQPRPVTIEGLAAFCCVGVVIVLDQGTRTIFWPGEEACACQAWAASSSG